MQLTLSNYVVINLLNPFQKLNLGFVSCWKIILFPDFKSCWTGVKQRNIFWLFTTRGSCYKDNLSLINHRLQLICKMSSLERSYILFLKSNLFIYRQMQHFICRNGKKSDYQMFQYAIHLTGMYLEISPALR